ncbi:hypothetical protein [uncultured Azohydromonas sp.]|nr:hypothetical protein [uncultured Azohydromonas sp.]
MLHVVPAVPPHAAAALSHDIAQDCYRDEAESVFRAAAAAQAREAPAPVA